MDGLEVSALVDRLDGARRGRFGRFAETLGVGGGRRLAAAVVKPEGGCPIVGSSLWFQAFGELCAVFS